MTYTIEVENVGPESALDITITDEMNIGMALDQIVTSQGGSSESAGLISCNLVDLEPGISAQVRIVVIPDLLLLGEIVVNESTVKSSRFDPITFNNSASSTVLEAISLVRIVRDATQL